MRLRSILMICAAMIVVSSCDNDERGGSVSPFGLTANHEEPPPPPANANEIQFQNWFALIGALETFKAVAGQYPSDVGGDPLPSGETLVDLLPNGELLFNPYLGVRSEPWDGAGLYVPGAIGYVPIDPDGDGDWDSYYLEMFDGKGMLALIHVPRYSVIRGIN